MERIIPDVMKEPLVTDTAATEENAAPAETAATKQTARSENLYEGQCPSCGKTMKLSVANGIPVHVCLQHSVVMPLRDQEPLNVQ